MRVWAHDTSASSKKTSVVSGKSEVTESRFVVY